MYVKAGSIIPRKFIKRLSSIETLQDPILLDIFINPVKKPAAGFLYIDDGLTFNHTKEEEYSYV